MNLESRLKTQETLTATLQSQMVELQKSIATPVDVAQIDLNTQDIDLLKQILGITDESKPGDISILGKFTASGIETGVLTIKVADEDSPTIGEDKILVGETSVTVKTKAASKDSRIFVTSKIVTDQPLAVTKINNEEGFVVEIKNPATADIKFDWWAVEEK